ncbi:MAG TPA: 50S ribosomal protein L28 [Acidimicrobiales bacterium]|nr:50S ribosomal protein L28 [Acidimicrobiales bacterium]
MGSVCEVCGKAPSFGKKLSRLGKGAMHRRIKARNPRRFNPNIQRVRAVVDGRVRRIDVCTGCIKAGKVRKPPRRTQP